MTGCSNCWAMLHCERCWAITGYIDDFTGQTKEEFCENNKRIIMKAFKLYARLLGEKPGCMKAFNDVVIG